MKTVDQSQFTLTKSTIVPDTQNLIAVSNDPSKKHPYIVVYEQEVLSYDPSKVIGGKVRVKGGYKMKIEDIKPKVLRVWEHYETLDEAKEEILPESVAYLGEDFTIVEDSSYEVFRPNQEPAKYTDANGQLVNRLDEKTGKEFFTQTRLVSKLDQYGNPIYGKDRNAQTAQAQVVSSPKETLQPIES